MSSNLTKMEQVVNLRGSDYTLCYRSVNQEGKSGSSFGLRNNMRKRLILEWREVNQETEGTATTWIFNSQPSLSGPCIVYVLCVCVDKSDSMCVNNCDSLLSNRTPNSSHPCTCCSPIQKLNLFLFWINLVICFDQQNVAKAMLCECFKWLLLFCPVWSHGIETMWREEASQPSAVPAIRLRCHPCEGSPLGYSPITLSDT